MATVNQQLLDQLRKRLDRARAHHDPLVRAKQTWDILDTLAVIQHEAAQVRAEAIQRLRHEGWSLGEIAHELDISRARVAQVSGPME